MFYRNFSFTLSLIFCDFMMFYRLSIWIRSLFLHLAINTWHRLPQWPSGRESACQCRRCRRWGFYPGSGRSPGEGNGSPLQYSCLENPMDRGAWWATVHGVAKESDTPSQLNNNNNSNKGMTVWGRSIYCFIFIVDIHF